MIKSPNAVQMKASAGPITVQLQGKWETASLFLGEVVEWYGVLENSNWYEQTGPIKSFYSFAQCLCTFLVADR